MKNLKLLKNLTMRQLRIFQSAARHGSFSKAATELNLSAPAVSMQIKEFEIDIGMALFARVGRRVELTSEPPAASVVPAWGCGAGAAGSSRVKQAPWPGLASAQTRPPWRMTMRVLFSTAIPILNRRAAKPCGFCCICSGAMKRCDTFALGDAAIQAAFPLNL